MNPSNHAAAYDIMSPLWKRCRDFIAGEDTVKGAGKVYLPALTGQTDEQYVAYKDRAKFFNAAARTHEAMTGLLFRSQAEATFPEQFANLAADVTRTGVSMAEFATEVADEVLTTGRVGILVEYPSESAETALEEEALGLRPYLAMYKAEDILNWRRAGAANRSDLSMVALQEITQEPDPKDEFATIDVHRVRVLEMYQGAYRQRLFRYDGKSWALEDTINPTMGGAPIGWIPFVFVGPRNTQPNVDKPPLLDLVNLNKTHYNLSADYYHGLHFTALPTPVITGVSSDTLGGAMTIGSTKAWVLPPADAEAKFLEFQGQGLNEVAKELAQLKDEMAATGSRILASDPKGVESAEAAGIRRAGENSVLMSMALAVGGALTTCSQYMLEWAGAGDEAAKAAVVALNTDYSFHMVPPAMFAELTKAYLSNALTFADYVAKLKEWSIVDPARPVEVIQAELQTAAPVE